MIRHIVEQFLLHLPLLFGAAISFSLLKVPDLSIETAYVSGAFFGSYAVLACKDFSWPLQIVVGVGASLLIGCFVGIISSFFTKFLRVSHLLSTIMTTGFFYTVNQALFGPYFSLHSARLLLTSNNFGIYSELPFLFVSGVVLLIIVGCLFRSNLGYLWAVYGINREFLCTYGVSEKTIFFLGICVANMLAGYAGYLQAQSNGFVEITIAFGKSLVCLTSLIIGKIVVTSLHPISLLRPLVGGLGYFFLQAFLIRVGCNTIYFSAMQAIIIAVMLGLNRRMSSSNDDLGV